MTGSLIDQLAHPSPVRARPPGPVPSLHLYPAGPSLDRLPPPPASLTPSRALLLLSSRLIYPLGPPSPRHSTTTLPFLQTVRPETSLARIGRWGQMDRKARVSVRHGACPSSKFCPSSPGGVLRCAGSPFAPHRPRPSPPHDPSRNLRHAAPSLGCTAVARPSTFLGPPISPAPAPTLDQAPHMTPRPASASPSSTTSPHMPTA